GFEALVFKASRGIEDIYELTYIRKDGSRFPALVSVTALRDARDTIIGYLLIGTDNTARKEVEAERKRFERALEEKNVELEHASRMKSEFLATMSHELRTPLNAIIGFSEALKDGLMGTMPGTQLEYISDIFTSGQHLLSLINDILDLSKVEAGMMALELQAVDLETLLSNSLSIVREKAAGQRIQVELEAASGLGQPLLDMRKTKQIVYNLLSNAVKFSASGGRVVMRARQVPRAVVGTFAGDWPKHGFDLVASNYGEFIEIVVSDGGIGISQADMLKLFQPFSQIDSSLARKFEGTGLGLAMVKLMAELHGGTVAVSSLEGHGTHFAVWLPSHADFPNATGAIPAFGSDGASPRVPQRVALVVDDDDSAADLARLLLEEEGFTVVRAATAESALAMAQVQPLALITLDVNLPGMDGWELLQRLSGIDSLSRVPVVVISSGTEGYLALARGAGAVLQKPVSRTQLRTSLNTLGLQPGPRLTYTVLVVDDDPMAVEVIANFLPAPAYAVVRAYGGVEAVALAQRLCPDLILLDLMMPDIDCFGVVEALQADPGTATIPVLIVTAKQVSASDRAGLGSHRQRVGIVEKASFNRVQFLEEVRRALPQS
ncbi:MAG: response regulator, partial [Usitatibacter sp.]